MTSRTSFAAACGILLSTACTAPRTRPLVGPRVCIFDCGTHRTTDLSPWTPGENVDRPWTFANHCYLIEHPRGRLLWDSGYPDTIHALPDGLELPGGTVRVHRPETLRAQFESMGLVPSDVTHVAFSHFHFDHAGNGNMFLGALLLVQAAEHAAAFGPEPESFGFDPSCYGKLRTGPCLLLSGDHDVFGDGTVVILFTPGHTPGHQSLLLRLPHRGSVILSGDTAHVSSNQALRRVPVTNFDRVRSVASMQRIADLVAREHAELWINHDREQSSTLPKAPAWID